MNLFEVPLIYTNKEKHKNKIYVCIVKTIYAQLIWDITNYIFFKILKKIKSKNNLEVKSKISELNYKRKLAL